MENGDNIFKKNCEILEIYKNNVLVKAGDEKFVAKTTEQLNKQDVVNLYKKLAKNEINIFVYLLPIMLFILGFGFGFLFKNELYHFLLVLGVTFLGLIVLVIVRVYFLKRNKIKYIVKKVCDNKEVIWK